MKQFSKILIANRGEIAVRIIRAAQKNGILSVAVYAADDADSLHVSLADEAILLPGKTLAETYLNQDLLIQIAIENKAEAIHPGYGFLAEHAGFAQKVAGAGLVFVGPTPENIRLMGEKNSALTYVESLGVPILKSFRGSKDELLKYASMMEFPVMVKASGGGGGKGMLICRTEAELLPALQKAERQAVEYFGNGDLFVEKYLPRARHIEVQLMADNFGNVIHFFERECSVQRRFQKIIEEAPSPSVSAELREKLTSTAVRIAQSMNYRNAGTIEFLLDENGKFYFLEMNTRIQVEHPVTEMITGTDLVSMQLSVATGNPLSLRQNEIQIKGHAIEARLCAEDSDNDFHPSVGPIEIWDFPEADDWRLETFVKPGINISPNYDSLLAKVVVFENSREKAAAKMEEILSHSAVSGVRTNQQFLLSLFRNPEFIRNTVYTKYIDENLAALNQQVAFEKNLIGKESLVAAYWAAHFIRLNQEQRNSVWSQIGYWRIFPELKIQIDQQIFTCEIHVSGNEIKVSSQDKVISAKLISKEKNRLKLDVNDQTETFIFQEGNGHTRIFHKGFSFEIQSKLRASEIESGQKKNNSERVFENLIHADLFGRILKINVRQGDHVVRGQVLLTLESMKTEIHVSCSSEAIIKKIYIKEGEAVTERQLLIELEEN